MLAAARSAVVGLAQADATTGWPSLGWTTTKPGPWKASWKDSPEPRPMREPILKVLLICGCRFADHQIAACGSTKVGCWEQSRSNGRPSESGVFVSFSGGVWLSSAAVGRKTPQPSFVYDIAMGKHLLHGRRVSDEQIQAWADEAEAGYDLRRLPRPTPGRPPVGRGPGIVVTVRLDEELLAALLKRAADEGIANRSDAVRAAVKQWAHAAA